MFMLDWKDIGWWYWLVLSCLLNLSAHGLIDGYPLVILIAAVHLLHYAQREGSLQAFSVQVRWAFLAYVLIAYQPGMQWMFWLPAIGTIARVTIGYCLLARLLMLMPFNRTVPLTWSFVRRALLGAPVRGSVLHGLGAYEAIGS
jgi:hypothetical protein